jgi:TRAP-type C4-dicarboxylate transport system permease small subunit
LKVLNYIVFYLDRILRIIGNLILSTILIVITLGIISRYVFNAPFTWTEELTTFLMVNLGYISGTIVTIANKHVVADFLIAKTPPAFKKTMAIFGKLISICVFLLIAVSAYQQFVTRAAYRTAALGIPRPFFYAPLMVMCSVMVFVVVVDILNEIFPGYNIREIAAKKEAELALQEEMRMAEESEKEMDEFLQTAKNETGNNSGA